MICQTPRSGTRHKLMYENVSREFNYKPLVLSKNGKRRTKNQRGDKEEGGGGEGKREEEKTI